MSRTPQPDSSASMNSGRKTGRHTIDSWTREYEAIEARIAGAYEKWIRDGGFVFKARPNVVGHRNVAKFNWEMVPANGGQVAAAGFDFFVLGDAGRIRYDYQFGES